MTPMFYFVCGIVATLLDNIDNRFGFHWIHLPPLLVATGHIMMYEWLKTMLAVLAKRDQLLILIAETIGKGDDLGHTSEVFTETDRISETDFGDTEQTFVDSKYVPYWNVVLKISLLQLIDVTEIAAYLLWPNLLIVPYHNHLLCQEGEKQSIRSRLTGFVNDYNVKDFWPNVDRLQDFVDRHYPSWYSSATFLKTFLCQSTVASGIFAHPSSKPLKGRAPCHQALVTSLGQRGHAVLPRPFRPRLSPRHLTRHIVPSLAGH